MKKIKILHIIPGLKTGGAEILLKNLVDNLNKRDIENYVIYFESGEILEQLNCECFKVERPKFKYSLITFLKVFRIAKKVKPNCLHGWIFWGNFITRCLGFFLKVPVLNSLHSSVEQLNKRSFLEKFLDRCTLFYVDKMVAVSNDIVRATCKKNKIEVIKNGIDYYYTIKKGQELKKNRKDLDIKDKDFVFGTVGNLLEYKNHKLILEAFSNLCIKYKNLKLILIGSGPQESFLKKRAEELKIQDKVLFLVGVDAIGYYQLFDCFVFTSLVETVSLAILESMAFSIPVIVSAPNKKHEVVTPNVDGFVIELNDKNDLIKKMELLIIDKNLRCEIGDSAKNTVISRFSFEIMTDKYINIYKGLIFK